MEVFQTSNLDKRSLVLLAAFRKEMRNPLPDPLKQAESSLQVTLGKRREFLSSELRYLLGSLPFNLKKIQESSLLVNMDRTPPAKTTYKFSTSSSTRRELPPM